MRWIAVPKVSLFPAPDFKTSKTYRDACQWYQSFLPEEGKSYSQHLELAREKYVAMTDANAAIDSKADSLFRFAAALLTAIVGAISLFKPASDELWPWVPSCVFLMLSVACAITAKRTVELPGPLSVRHAIELHPDRDLTGTLAATYFTAYAGMSVVNEWKAQWSDRATFLIVLSLVCLVLPPLV